MLPRDAAAQEGEEAMTDRSLFMFVRIFNIAAAFDSSRLYLARAY